MGHDALLDSLRAIVGERHCLTDPALRASFETDWTRRFHGEAVAVVRPGSTREVAGVLRACFDARVGVVPQGGNTGLVGGSVPRGGEVVLSLRRLDDIGNVDSSSGQVTVGAGATLAAVQRAAGAAGWAFGIDLGARDSVTVGGMAATNAGGVNVVRHGPMRSQLIGFEAVLADGSIIRRLPGMPKDNTGFDLAGLIAGSEGTLAVITRLGLRLVPQLRHRAVCVIGFEDAAAAVDAAGVLRRRLATVHALELFTHAGVDLVMRHASVAAPFAARMPVYLLVEVASDESDPADGLYAALESMAVDDASVAVATETDSRHRLWQPRERHTEAINAEGVPHKLDVSVPASRYAELVERAPQAVRAVAPDARTIVYGHVGDGNLHVNVLGPAPDDETVDDAILGLVVELGGSVSAEHGIGVAKVGWLPRDRGEDAVRAMRAIKTAWDPRNILNPGVLFAADPAGSSTSAGRDQAYDQAMTNTTHTPATDQYGFLETNGARIYYEVEGSGPPVVLIHAGVANLRMWDDQVPALRDAYRVIRYDTRGYGRTETDAVEFSNRADIAALLDHLGEESAHLVGISRAGAIALDFALEYPDRVRSLVVGAGGISGYQSPDGSPDEDFEVEERLYEAKDWEGLAAWEADYWGNGPGQPADRVPEVRARIYEWELANYRAGKVEGTPQPLDPPAAGRLGDLKVPLLVILGTLDEPGTSGSMRHLAEAVPNARLEVFEGVAHMLNLERPDRFNALLRDFLDGMRAR
jgi:FAD/FMN-containing dehydrogenase/pimeloyl-ACP methyl ester carboxylesterase